MLFAVHIADGVLQDLWCYLAFVPLALAVPLGLWKITDRDVVRVGVFTAAFFVASSVHIPFALLSVHLLLNGLVGVILRHRSVLAIAVGLFLQALLFGHGGFVTLGVNFLVMALPALAAGYAFHALRGYCRALFARDLAFWVGLVIGAGTTTVTVLLHAAVLLLLGTGDGTDWSAVAGLSLLAHLPVVVIEGLGVGFAVRVLAKAKPEWLGGAAE